MTATDLRSDKCPACAAYTVTAEGDSVDIGATTATQECSCLECGAQWVNVYTLSRFYFLDPESRIEHMHDPNHLYGLTHFHDQEYAV